MESWQQLLVRMLQSLLLLSQLFWKRLGWFCVRYPFLLPLLSRHSITLFCGSIDLCWHQYCLSGVSENPVKLGFIFVLLLEFFSYFNLPYNYPEDVKKSSELSDFTGGNPVCSPIFVAQVASSLWKCLFFSQAPFGERGLCCDQVAKSWPGAGCILWGAVCLEVKYCTVLSPLSLCESVPKYLCHLKIQTEHQITTVIINILGGLRSEAKEQTGDGGSNVTSGRQDWVQMGLRTSGFSVGRGCPVVKQGGDLIVMPFTCLYLFKFTFETSQQSKFCCDNQSASWLC